MDDELLYQLALCRVPNIGDIQGRILINIFSEASAIFKAPLWQLERVEGIGTIRAAGIKAFKDFAACEREIGFITDNNITPLFILDKSYPARLLNCYDSPLMLYYKGTASLNAPKIISVVGTRGNSDYGKFICEKIILELKEQDILIMSGLAFGIDTVAHKAALRNGLSTVGVLAHGHDRIYPAQNKTLAADMMLQGGLLTDFTSGTLPDKQNFPKRNRIVAGLCDALLVIESKKKGGSLITAEIAGSYNKDIFSVPGRTNDYRSEGCNYLIKSNKASMITCAADLLEQMNWLPKQTPIIKQRELFLQLTSNEQLIVDVLQKKGSLHIDDLYQQTTLSSSKVAEALLMLEMQGVISGLPGKMFRIC